MLSNDQQQRSVIFLRPLCGYWIREVSPDEPNAKEHVSVRGRRFWYHSFISITGKINDIYRRKKDEFDDLIIVMIDENKNEEYRIQLPIPGRLFRSFCCMLPNVSLTDSLTMRISREDNKDSLFIEQNGRYLKHFWTKDNPRDKPPAKFITVNNKQVLDFSNETEYFVKYIDKVMSSHRELLEAYSEDSDPFEFFKEDLSTFEFPKGNSDTFEFKEENLGTYEFEEKNSGTTEFDGSDEFFK